MNYLYHIVPEEMKGNILYPIAQLSLPKGYKEICWKKAYLRVKNFWIELQGGRSN